MPNLTSARMSSPIEIVCHRGANHVAPENTLAAARKCLEWGANYVEVDVRTSRDGVFYVLHDPTVDRTSNGTGLLRDLSSEEIDQLDAGSWFSSSYAGEPIPRLETFLEMLKGTAGVFFDVKDADLGKLIELTEAVGFASNSFFWFGDDEIARTFHQYAPTLSLKINAYSIPEVDNAVRIFGANIIETSLPSLTADFKRCCQSYGLRVMVLESSDSPEIFQRIIDAGPDMVNIDHPDLFLAAIRSQE